MILGVWGHITNKQQAGITGTKFLPGRHLLRKDALLAVVVPNSGYFRLYRKLDYPEYFKESL